MEATPLPLSFVRNRLALTWADVEWGYRKGWLDDAGVVEYSFAQLAGDHDPNPALVELAGLSRSELANVPLLLEKVLCAAAPEETPNSEHKWLYLVLAWVYDRRAELNDPLGVVEQLYADFGYPRELRAFVRYMPPEDHYEPQAHTHPENVAHLFSKWHEYLESFSSALHKAGTDPAGKSEFPASWSDDQIMHHISDIATDPAATRTPGRGGRTLVEGTRDGVAIRVVLEPDGSIVTGFPTNVPRNPR